MVKGVFGCKCESAGIKGIGEGEFSCLCCKNHVAARLDFVRGKFIITVILYFILYIFNGFYGC